MPVSFLPDALHLLRRNDEDFKGIAARNGTPDFGVVLDVLLSLIGRVDCGTDN